MYIIFIVPSSYIISHHYTTLHITISGEDTWFIHYHLNHGHYKKEFLMKWNALANDLADTASVGSFNVTSGMLDREDCEGYLMKRFGLSKEDLKEGPVIRWFLFLECCITHVLPSFILSFFPHSLSYSLSHLLTHLFLIIFSTPSFFLFISVPPYLLITLPPYLLHSLSH